MDPRPDYNQWHLSHEMDDDISTPWHNFAMETAANLTLSGSTVLEIGCGRGGFANALLTRFPGATKYFACDYSESALEIARRRLSVHANAEVFREDIQNLSFNSGSIDLAISCETIEHVPDAYKALENLHRVLKPGGHLILTCPNYFNFFGIWCLYRKLIGKPFTEGGQPYVRYILFPFIYYKLKRLGFEVLHFHSSELILPARRPKTFYGHGTSAPFRFFGYRTYYLLRKK